MTHAKHSSLRISFTTGVLCVILLTLSIIFQIKHDSLSLPFTTKVKAETRNLLPARFLPYVTFGFVNIITDSYWIRSVQDFTVWDGKDEYYLNYFKNISTLDPTFEYPYLFSILIVPQNKNVATLNKIAEFADNGIQAIPTSWQIPFYLGTQYYLFTKKYNPAEKYLSIAAKVHGAPDGVFLVYSTLAGRNNPLHIKSESDFILAKELLKVIYNNTDNETIKEMASKGIEEKSVNQMLEKGIIAYKEKYKRYPKSVDEMLTVHFISLPQTFLDSFTVEISGRDGSFRVIIK